MFLAARWEPLICKRSGQVVIFIEQEAIPELEIASWYSQIFHALWEFLRESDAVTRRSAVGPHRPFIAGPLRPELRWSAVPFQCRWYLVCRLG